jgi:hypothetical protein
MVGNHDLQARDQVCRNERLDLDDHTGKARRQRGRNLPAGLEDYGNSGAHQALHDGRTIPVQKVQVQNRGNYDRGREQGQGFLATRGGTDDYAAGVFNGQRQIQRDEGLVLGHKDGSVVEQ